MRKILIIGIITLLLLLPVSSAIGIKTKIANDNIKTYKFAIIKTTRTSAGSAFCFPGLLRSFTLIGSILIHSYVFYDDDYWEGWYLTINDDKVSRGRGYIFGFTGKITNWYGGLGFKPEYCAFELDGFALLIIYVPD